MVTTRFILAAGMGIMQTALGMYVNGTAVTQVFLRWEMLLLVVFTAVLTLEVGISVRRGTHSVS